MVQTQKENIENTSKHCIYTNTVKTGPPGQQNTKMPSRKDGASEEKRTRTDAGVWHEEFGVFAPLCVFADGQVQHGYRSFVNHHQPAIYHQFNSSSINNQ